MAALRTASETPERLWSSGMAAALGEELAHLAGQARAAQVRRQNTTNVGNHRYLLIRCPRAVPARRALRR